MRKRTAAWAVLTAVGVVFAGLSAPPGAGAQSSAPFSGLASDVMSPVAQIPIPFGLSRSPQDQAAHPANGVHAVTTYHRSPDVSARVVRQYVAWFAKISDPQKAQALQAQLTQHDPVSLWAEAERSDDLKPGDVADAAASYWVMNWMIANGVQATTAAQVQGVLRQIRPTLTASRSFAALSEAQRQEMAETLMVNYVMQSAAYGGAMKQGNTDLCRRLGDAAVTRFQNEARVDLRRIRLTDRGFVPRTSAASGTDSPDAAPARPPASPADTAGKPTLGGPVKPGLYVGDEVCTGIGGKELWRNHWRLSLYADGEWRIVDEHNRPPRASDTGRYKYDPHSGKINVNGSFHMSNDSVDPGDALCVYGRDGGGTPFILGKDRVINVVALLRYAGPAPRPAPDAEAQAKAAAGAEARRYKWVTPPGRGLQNAQIAAIVHNYHVQVYYGGSGLGTNTTDEPYLLLTDGTIHDGLPVAPDQMDVPLSRRREPEKWGHWKQSGGRYVVSWGGAAYKPLPGKRVLPGTPGTRLQGHWGAGEASSSLMGGSYRLWGVTFSKDGRLVKDQQGGSGNSQFMQTGGAPAISTQYDDNGSSTAILGGSFTATAGHKGGAASHRAGTYTISGWVMTLHYDDGRIERMPFFFADPAHEELYFEGAKVGRDDKK